MRNDPARVIVGHGDLGNPVCTTLVHHQAFPELWAEGTTPLEGARRLVDLLVSACDWATEDWRRTELRGALDDVNEFLKQPVPSGMNCRMVSV